jgi:hypothetical protein
MPPPSASDLTTKTSLAFQDLADVTVAYRRANVAD